MKNIIRVVVLCLITMSLGVAVNAATFVVNTTNDTADANPGDGTCADASAMCSLRAAISEANALAGDDIITLPAGTYTQSLVAANEDLNAGGDWDIRSNITINGAGAATTIVQAAATPGTATERVMESALNTNVVVINGVTLRHGNKTGTAATTTRGGGIRNLGTLTMNDCIVTLNNASGAGGVRNELNITLNNVVVSNNACNTAGGSCFGGGMYNTLAAFGTIVINNSQFTSNTATSTLANAFGFGAGLGIESASGFNITITNSSFTNNSGVGNGTAGSNGSGIRLLANGAATANITNTSFNSNNGTGGASIQGQGITVFTSGAAGTITGTWDRVTVNGHTGTAAAGVFVDATGGAANLTIRNSTISNNNTTGAGGGIVLSNIGATVNASSTFNISNSTISGNTANGNGAGVLVEQPAAGTITTNFNFCTIANNRANNDNSGTESGGGIFQSSGTVNLKNSIVADNSVGTGGAGPDIFGTVNSENYNHIEDVTGATIGGNTTNNATGDPQLGALANNGGATQTHLPAGGSPVVNTIPNGTNECGTTVTTDQRGNPRPASTGCEKGSVEVTAAILFANISGQTLTAGGNGIRNVIVTVSGGGLPQPLVAQTGSLGWYSFNGLSTGQTYTVSVSAKRFTFTPASQMVTLTMDVNQNFIADPGFGVIPNPESGVKPAVK